MRWAMINGNMVTNIIIWDGQGDLFAGKKVVQIQDGEWCAIGALYDENAPVRFAAVSTEEQPEEQPEG